MLILPIQVHLSSQFANLVFNLTIFNAKSAAYNTYGSTYAQHTRSLTHKRGTVVSLFWGVASFSLKLKVFSGEIVFIRTSTLH